MTEVVLLVVPQVLKSFGTNGARAQSLEWQSQSVPSALVNDEDCAFSTAFILISCLNRDHTLIWLTSNEEYHEYIFRFILGFNVA